jgi:transposase
VMHTCPACGYTAHRGECPACGYALRGRQRPRMGQGERFEGSEAKPYTGRVKRGRGERGRKDGRHD